MPRIVRVHEIDRDEEFGIIKKDISVSSSFSFKTPSKSIKPKSIKRFGQKPHENIVVNEIVRRVDAKTLVALEEGYPSFKRDIRSKFLSDKLNLTIFDLKFDSVPDKDPLKILSHNLYSSSDTTFCLPTVKSGLLKEGKKYTEGQIKSYIGMMEFIIDEIEGVGNNKPLIGTIPLMPAKFSKPIVDFYVKKGITSFAIDAGTKDIFSHEADFRVILSEINDSVPLNEAFIYACNCGIPKFQTTETRADDFLSIFAYVDVLGGTFKSRYVSSPPPNWEPKAKLFFSKNYSYRLYTYADASQKLGYPLYYNKMIDYNQLEQLKETNQIENLVGEENMRSYLQTKSAVDPILIKRLEKIVSGVKA